MSVFEKVGAVLDLPWPSVILWLCHSVTTSDENFRHTFSGSGKSKKLKHGARIDSGLVYRSYQNQDTRSYSSLYLFSFLSLQFETLKICVTFETYYARERWVDAPCVSRNQTAAAFISNFQTLHMFVTLFSETMRPTKLKLDTHMDNRWMYNGYWNKAAAAYWSFYFFMFLSLQSQTFVFLFR